MPTPLDRLRRLAITRSLFTPTGLEATIGKLGFVQADPIRAPARAQDLTLRHRVEGYRAGMLERCYAQLPVEEEFFVNYGFLPRQHVQLLQPRTPRHPWDRTTKRRAAKVLELVCDRGEVHPREVDQELALGTVTNYWGGTSSATTHLLDGMHYRGLLRVCRREAGIRIYAPRKVESSGLTARQKAEALIALAMDTYGPMPARSLGQLTSKLRLTAPQLGDELGKALTRARQLLPHDRADGVDWYWPEGEAFEDVDDGVRLLAPFDPVVWDRLRFELFWGWAYRFEAYTPKEQRKLGYYALPMLFRDRVIGWANLSLVDDQLHVETGYVAGSPPRDRTFKRELDAEIARMRVFLSPD